MNEILNALFAIAYSDKILHENEEKMLIDCAKIFGINQETYNRIKSIYNDQKYKSNSAGLQRSYDLLGVKETDSMDIITKKYKNIVREYHPDKIQGKGLPKEFIDFANKKLTDFNEAYNEIKKNRI